MGSTTFVDVDVDVVAFVWPGSLKAWPSSLKVWPSSIYGASSKYGASRRYGGVRAAAPRACCYSSSQGLVTAASGLSGLWSGVGECSQMEVFDSLSIAAALTLSAVRQLFPFPMRVCMVLSLQK